MYGFESWDYKESWAPKNWCFWTVLEKTLQSPLDCNEIQSVHPKGDQSWIFIGRNDAEAETNTLANWCKELTHLRRPWCWERLKEGEGGDRGWAGWMASTTQWTWVWVKSGSWWWTGRPGMLQSMGSQRVGHHWATELKWGLKTPLSPDTKNLPYGSVYLLSERYWRLTQNFNSFHAFSVFNLKGPNALPLSDFYVTTKGSWSKN